MQFNSNDDFPASGVPIQQWETLARQPVPFDQADPVPCACITTRIFIRAGTDSGLAKTIKGVLVRTPAPAVEPGGGGWSDSSSSDDSETDNDDESMSDAAAAAAVAGGRPVDGGRWPASPSDATGIATDGTAVDQRRVAQSQPVRAYWLRRTLRQAIYGHVRYGVVLRRLNPPLRVPCASNPAEIVTVEWEATDEAVAVKEMGWEHIRAQRDRLMEDPIKEVAAMQYLRRWLDGTTRIAHLKPSPDMNAAFGGLNLVSSGPNNGGTTGCADTVATAAAAEALATSSMMGIPQAAQAVGPRPYAPPHTMLESHILMPCDLLTDNRNLYSIMPYCTGGELFDVLERRHRFTEPEARYWMRQVIQGLACLKDAGISHRDVSLENLLIHDGNILVIDMGMSLRIPCIDPRTKQRFLVHPQGTCGKWHYMSPEICRNREPFDGHAVDLWAAGVILFLMLTGFPPWEQPRLTDERFRFMTNGYLVQMLTEWQVGLSADAMDLLQRMFWIDPTDRLSLEQVWAHPWMMNGHVQAPT